jgi:hypothetical protein
LASDRRPDYEGTNDQHQVERDGKYFIEIVMDGSALHPRGPFPTSDEAESTAFRLASVCRVLNQPVSVGGRMLAPATPRMAAPRKR